MKVIGAGFGRTGTLSLKAALEQLGFAPCYHMVEILEHPEHAKVWMDATAGRPVDWRSFLQSYPAGVDVPLCMFYKELMAVYPDAKVLLSVRDPERWYDSAHETIYAISQTWPMRWTSRYLPRIGAVWKMVTPLIWEGMFQGRFHDRAFAIEMFNRHNQEVIRTVAPERLLVFDVKQGWPPLCHFLGVPVPEGVPFPHLNDTAVFKTRVRRARIMSSAILGVLGLGVVAASWALLRRRHNRSVSL